jgi:hypothetical protein
MSDFEVIEKDNLSSLKTRLPQESVSEKGMIGFLMRKGIVKSENIGTYVLIGVAIFFFAMSFLAFQIL